MMSRLLLLEKRFKRPECGMLLFMYISDSKYEF